MQLISFVVFKRPSLKMVIYQIAPKNRSALICFKRTDQITPDWPRVGQIGDPIVTNRAVPYPSISNCVLAQLQIQSTSFSSRQHHMTIGITPSLTSSYTDCLLICLSVLLQEKMPFCGPKCSLCCTIVSIWGIVQLVRILSLTGTILFAKTVCYFKKVHSLS